jgi:hypothetical protein
MHAPTAAIRALPAPAGRSTSALSRGLKRIAVRVGRESAVRSRRFPAFDRPVCRLPARHLVPEGGAALAANRCSGSWARPYDGVCGTM